MAGRTTAESTRYYVRWRDEYGKYHDEPAGTTLKAAEALKNRLERERSAGTLKPPNERKPKTKPPTLAEYYEMWMEAKRGALKESSVVSYEHTFRNHILPALGEKRLDDLRPSNIQEWVNGLEDLSPATIGRAYRYLRSCVKQAVASGVTENDPCRARAIMLPRVPHEEPDFLTPGELRTLLDASPEPERSLFAVLAYSGLRLGEALALRWRDVDFEMNAIKVLRAYSVHGGIQDPKTASSRRAVPLIPILAEILVPQRGKPDSLLFTKGQLPIDPSNARKVFNDSLERAGLKHVTLHSLRHSYATVMIASGASIKALQRALGHASANMTLNVYAHLFEESMDEPVLRADALLRGLQNGSIISVEEQALKRGVGVI